MPTLEQENKKLKKTILKLQKKLEKVNIYKNIVNTLSISISIAKYENNKLKLIYVNEAFEKVTGYSKKDVIGKKPSFLQKQNKDQKAIKVMKSAIKNHETCEVEVINYKKDGTAFTNFLYLSPIFDKQNNLTHYIGLQQDISEMKKKDKVINQQAKLASMGEMIANISHQWRQPLSVISTGATGILLQKEMGILSDEILIDVCESINHNAQYLSNTIDDFKNFIKGDSESIRFNLKNDTDVFIKLVDATIKEYNINIILDLNENINVQGYPNELIQCFINIFNNSKDALLANNDEDDRYIFISETNEDTLVHISFKDNAGGISEDIIDKIFEPYFTTKHKSQGTGIGLHMSYRLITESMNGTIRASNVEYEFNGKLYKGAKFDILIPIQNDRLNR